MPVAEDAPVDEHERVLRWREDEALDLGLTPQAAYVFAKSDGDLGELRALVKRGCPPDIAFDLVT
jgi:hypothetical protein